MTRLLRALRWIAILLVAFFALTGFLYLTRGTAVQRVTGVGGDGSAMNPSEPQFPLGVAMLTGTPLTAGNRVELALNGDGTFPRLWEDLRSAQQSITLQLYYRNHGRTADTLREILIERARAGVRVLALYDAFGFDHIRGEHREALRAAGVMVVPFRPLRLSTLHLAQNRSHVRGIVIDGRVGWTGGLGIDDKWLGDGRTGGSWRETNVRFEGPAVRQLQAAFAASWVEATGIMLSGRATLDTVAGGVEAGLLYTAPTLGSTAAERFFALSIAGAQKRLYVTNAYFVPDDNFARLLEASSRRGVDVRVLAGGPRTDAKTVRWAGSAQYDRLLAAGVRIYEWQPSTLHAKTFVVDGVWSTIGSMNFGNRSMALNDECTVMVLDPAFGAEMDAVFLDDLRHATEVTPERHKERPWMQRLAEWPAYGLRRLF